MRNRENLDVFQDPAFEHAFAAIREDKFCNQAVDDSWDTYYDNCA